MSTNQASIKSTNSSISATTSSSAVALPTGSSDNYNIIVVNDGPNTAFVTTGVGSSTSTTANFPVQSGTTQSFSKPIGDNYGSAITATGTAAVYFITTSSL